MIAAMAGAIVIAGFATPIHAKTLAAGDLFQAEGFSTIYYYGKDGKRYVFPNEATYFSWYDDFSNILVLSREETAAIMIGGNIVIRPGTNLVKITTDPRVYAVLPYGMLAHIPDEETAIALYGDDWAKKVVDIPDAYFMDYETGMSNINATTYPAGSLIQKPDSEDVYYVMGDDTVRKFASEEAFRANKFRKKDIIITAETYEMPSAGQEITGVESLFNLIQPSLVLKPAIYLYPVREQATTVRLDYEGTIVADEPAYDPLLHGWEVIAHPDGRLVNHSDSKEYEYLFWEGMPSKSPTYDLSHGFVVKGADAEMFLRSTLEQIGLTQNETDAFVAFWAPKMEDHPYNLVYFAGTEYTDTAKLRITPQPDSVLRVFMVLKPLATPVSVKAQTFEPFVRNGFTVVEWGGTILH